MYIQYVEKCLHHEPRDREGLQAHAQEDDPEGDLKSCRSGSRIVGSDLRNRHDSGVRDGRSGQTDSGGRSGDKLGYAKPEPSQPHDADRDVHAGAVASCSKSECQERTVGSAKSCAKKDSITHDMDFEYIHDGQTHHYLSHVRKLVKKLEQELQQVMQQVESSHRHHQPRLDLLEVMCSADSELTSQVRKLGGKAERFGRVQGDLQTPEGRKRLFTQLVVHRPKHVWYSPECKPWCQWSNFNMSRSIESHEEIMQQRIDNLWQAALGIVLFRFQLDNHSHFDLEQPRGSAYWRIPGMSEILDNTYWNEFDLCRVGNLRDPSTHEPIRKRLTVCSTALGLHVSFHGKLCSGDHHHRNISGNTLVDGHTVRLSQWTENYPRKFAKQVAKVLIYDQKPQEHALTENAEEHPTKKRRLGSKLSPSAIEARFGRESSGVNWQIVMSRANQVAPRVGTKVIDSGEVLKLVQDMCPHHKIHHAVLCRGTDRYVRPNMDLPHGVAPLRRQICIRRKTEDIHVDEWEPWENLSNRGLRKKGVAARLSMTVFASAQPLEQSTTAQPSVPTSADANNPSNQRRVLDAAQIPDAKRHCHDRESPETIPMQPDRTLNSHENIHERPLSDTPTPHQDHMNIEPDSATESITPHHIDLASQKHGPLFQQLDAEEQNWLLKLHRNLGHPGAMKLREFCKQLNCPERITKAVSDIRCSTCQETKGPAISRPSAIHEPCDFGDIVSMDGVVWKNSKGDQFFFYHFLDQSTLFQTAVVAPAHTTEHACKALLTGWFNWAGPPGLLCVDSGTEMNSEEFSQFLQRHSVRCRTCAAEAHWQNARTERHGGIIQLMLNKMDHENPILNYDQLSVALSHATSTKNQWSKHRGYPPEMLVFGKGIRVPGSVTSDPTIAAHARALSSTPDGLRFRQDLATREAARKAFAEVDNDQTADGSWIGPMQVIIQENQNVVWVTRNHKLYRVPPEYVRSLSAMEEFQHAPHKVSQVPSDDQSIRPSHGGVQYHDMLPSSQDARASGSTEPSGANDVRAETVTVPRNSNPNGENPPDMSPSVSNPTDQPDNEPDVKSINSSNPNNDNPIIIPDINAPVEVPVPDTSNEEGGLYAEEIPCYHLQENQVFKFEVDINQQDINHWREETRPEEMLFLVSAAKKQRSEVRMSQLNSHDRKLFEEAKAKEIDSWLSTETVCKILRNKVTRENVMRCRWILTWKDADNSEESQQDSKTSGIRPPVQAPRLKPKARLVVLGFEDPLVDQIPRDSPTMSKLSRVLILQHAASLGYDICSFDIKTAFLRGTEQSKRILGIEPPEELRVKMKLQPNEIAQLLKGAYGRVDAPFLWFKELKQSLENLGFEAAPFDSCLFGLRDEKQRAEGLIGIHVDDGLCCGSPRFHAKLSQLEAKYPFGSKKNRDFVFTGLRISQKHDNAIWVSQEKYVKEINPISIGKDRKVTPHDAVNEGERQSLRALIGSLQYAAINTRPDLASRLGWLQSNINKATVATLLEANKTLHEAKMFADVTVKIQPIPLDHLRFVAFSDASFASEKVPDSHQGMMIMSCHKDIGDNKSSVVNPIVWHSKKIQKVVVSTLSAEAMSLAGAVDILSWIRLFWAWLRDGKCQWQLADETLLKLPPAFAAIPPEEETTTQKPPINMANIPSLKHHNHQSIITTDCKSLFDLISRHAPPSCQEFRTQLQAKLIKEHLNNGIMIRWVPSQAQLADALTKIMDASILRECMALGRYSLHDESQILRARSDSRAKLQWLRHMSTDSNQGK